MFTAMLSHVYTFFYPWKNSNGKILRCIFLTAGVTHSEFNDSGYIRTNYTKHFEVRNNTLTHEVASRFKCGFINLFRCQFILYDLFTV